MPEILQYVSLLVTLITATLLVWGGYIFRDVIKALMEPAAAPGCLPAKPDLSPDDSSKPAQEEFDWKDPWEGEQLTPVDTVSDYDPWAELDDKQTSVADKLREYLKNPFGSAELAAQSTYGVNNLPPFIQGEDVIFKQSLFADFAGIPRKNIKKVLEGLGIPIVRVRFTVNGNLYSRQYARMAANLDWDDSLFESEVATPSGEELKRKLLDYIRTPYSCFGRAWNLSGKNKEKLRPFYHGPYVFFMPSVFTKWLGIVEHTKKNNLYTNLRDIGIEIDSTTMLTSGERVPINVGKIPIEYLMQNTCVT